MKNQNVILNLFQDLIDCRGDKSPRNDAPVILSIYSVILSKVKDLINRFFGLRPQNDQPVILNFSEKQLRHCRNVFFVILRMFQDLMDCHGDKSPRNDNANVIASIAKQSRAFSLIELLISLIIISLLIAAFTPLITKKMKASDITVGSFGGKNNGDGTTIERNVTRDDCTRLNAVYVSAEETGDKPICVMKYNVGDGYYNEDWADVQRCQASESCVVSGETVDDLTPTCWKGTTASTYSSEFGGYSGQERTVCNWTGAKKLCENMGSNWRLPTDVELDSFANDAYTGKNATKGNLMLCNYNTSTTTPKCYSINACNGSEGNCNPYLLWSSGFTSDLELHTMRLGASWLSGSNNIKNAASARCVLDTVTETIKEVEKEVEVEKPTTPAEAPSEEFCAQFDSMFVPAKWSGSVDLCVNKYNVGDVTENGSGPTIPSQIMVVGAGSNCPLGGSGTCCWKGKTSPSCGVNGNGDSTYSGCNRTVCQRRAAIVSCSRWNPKGMEAGYWRLPTDAEVSSWATNLNYLAKNLGKDGLQLCDRNSAGYGSVLCKFSDSLCPGSTGSYCFQDVIIDETGHKLLSNGSLSIYGLGDFYTASVRCVYDGIKHYEDYYAGLKENADKQKICDKYNAMYLPPKYTGTSDGMCVTKYNAGDDGGPTYSNYAAIGVNVVGVGNSCSGGFCCWQGKTSPSCGVNGNGDSTYSGCNRTVCQRKAAKALCENWNPDGTTTGKWRLPTSSETAIWAANLNIINHFQGKDGLQLCDRNSAGYGSVLCKFSDSLCPGSTGSYCFQDVIIDETGHKLLSNGSLSIYGLGDLYTASVRCVSTEVLKE